MGSRIFITLPVKDLERSRAFFSDLGFAFNPQFSGEGAACMIISDEISVMLGSEEMFRKLSPKQICDTSTSNEVLLTLVLDSRAAVDAMVTKAKTLGGTSSPAPDDYGFMYQHDFTDLDGHGWGLMAMESAGSEVEG